MDVDFHKNLVKTNARELGNHSSTQNKAELSVTLMLNKPYSPCMTLDITYVHSVRLCHCCERNQAQCIWMSKFLFPFSPKVQSPTSPRARLTLERKVSGVLCFILMCASQAGLPSKEFLDKIEGAWGESWKWPPESLLHSHSLFPPRSTGGKAHVAVAIKCLKFSRVVNKRGAQAWEGPYVNPENLGFLKSSADQLPVRPVLDQRWKTACPCPSLALSFINLENMSGYIYIFFAYWFTLIMCSSTSRLLQWGLGWCHGYVTCAVAFLKFWIILSWTWENSDTVHISREGICNTNLGCWTLSPQSHLGSVMHSKSFLQHTWGFNFSLLGTILNSKLKTIMPNSKERETVEEKVLLHI